MTGKEQNLYPIVEKWMKRHFDCFKTGINTGLKYGRIDVAGVRDIRDELSGEVEVIAIEVKRGIGSFATACGQAFGYNVYANRVYLADFRNKEFSYNEKRLASHIGIGLIRIRKDGSCEEVMSSPTYIPLYGHSLKLLEKLSLGKCQVCGSFIEIGEKTKDIRFKYLTREKVKKAAKENKGLIFWNYEVADRKRKLGIRDTAGSYERRFVCWECVQIFLAEIYGVKPFSN